jgi:hypothetical protein
MNHICPVCGYPKLNHPPYGGVLSPSYDYCPACIFQFGVTDDDKGFTFEQWRKIWIDGGMVWDRLGHSSPPSGWDPKKQLENIGVYL